MQIEQVLIGTGIYYPRLGRKLVETIDPDMFSSPEARIVYQEMSNIYKRGDVADLDTLKGSLISSNNLHGAGGEVYLQKVIRMANPVGYGATIDRFKSQYEAAAIAREIAILQHKLEAGEQNILEDAIVRLDLIKSRTTSRARKLQELEDRRFVLENPPAKPNVLATIDSNDLMSDGNQSILAGPAKSGKSAVANGMVAGTIPGIDPKVSMGIVMKQNLEGQAVISFDTENSRFDHYRSVMRTLERGGIPNTPPWMYHISLRGKGVDEKIDLVEVAMSAYAKRHGGIFFVLLDGLTDLVYSSNDQAEAIKVINWVDELVTRYDCPALNVLHFNPNSWKTHGHLGTIANRKQESEISVIPLKDENKQEIGVSEVRFRGLRNAGGVKPIYIWFDKHLGYHVQYTGDISALVGKAEEDALPFSL